MTKVTVGGGKGNVQKKPNEGKLAGSELRSALRHLSRWTVSKSKLHREYKFADFIHAFGFMATAAIAIQEMGHHPEWSNVYNKVTVDLTTHDSGGITNKDIELAGKLEAWAVKLM